MNTSERQEASESPSHKEAIRKALAHPVRVEMFHIFSREESSRAELAASLGISSGRSHYHAGELLKVGLIKEVGTGKARGQTEHFYRAVTDSPTAREYLHRAPEPSSDRHRSNSIQTFAEAIEAASNAGTVKADDESVPTWLEIEADETSLLLAKKLTKALLDFFVVIAEQNQGRADATKAPLLRLVVGAAAFEAAPEQRD